MTRDVNAEHCWDVGTNRRRCCLYSLALFACTWRRRADTEHSGRSMRHDSRNCCAHDIQRPSCQKLIDSIDSSPPFNFPVLRALAVHIENARNRYRRSYAPRDGTADNPLIVRIKYVMPCIAISSCDSQAQRCRGTSLTSSGSSSLQKA